MMNYHYDNRKKKRTYRLLALVCFFIVIVFTPLLRVIYDVLERPLVRAWEQASSNAQETKNIFAMWYDNTRLYQENEALKKELRTRDIDLMRTQYLESVLASNQYFQQQQDSGFLFVTQGNIVSGYPQIRNGNFLINVGRDNGVMNNDIILSEEGTLLGTVATVSGTTSRITSITSKDTQTSALLLSTGESFVAEGNGVGLFALLPRESEVAIGDVVYHGLDPQHIIGVVREISFDPRDPRKYIYIGMVENINTVGNIGVLRIME
jgi:cell shape-determining protein MreC